MSFLHPGELSEIKPTDKRINDWPSAQDKWKQWQGIQGSPQRTPSYVDEDAARRAQYRQAIARQMGGQ